jgi:hypothetical protein
MAATPSGFAAIDYSKNFSIGKLLLNKNTSSFL